MIIVMIFFSNTYNLFKSTALKFFFTVADKVSSLSRCYHVLTRRSHGVTLYDVFHVRLVCACVTDSGIVKGESTRSWRRTAR